MSSPTYHVDAKPVNEFNTILRVFLSAGLAASTATAIVNPLELIKTRMQTIEMKDPKMFQVAKDIVKREGGIHKLWIIGLGVSCTRSLLYSSVRIGIYDPVKNLISSMVVKNENQLSLFWKAVSGLISGAFGSALMNPLDVVKIRFQSSGLTGVEASSKMYKNTLDALWKISTNEGFGALYKGTLVTMLRASILTSAQLSSYDHAKFLLLNNETLNKMFFSFGGYAFKDDTVTHVSCALISGLCTAIAISPVDVIKTKYMNDVKLKNKTFVNGQPSGEYSGVLDCVVKSVRKEGWRVLFRGFVPSYARLGPHFLISLPLYEQFRTWFGVGTM